MDEQSREIAAGLAEGSSEAWSRLYDAYGKRLWRELARLLGGRQADVADVVQETFLAAAGSTRSYDPQRGTPWAWLMGIARRQAALRLRSDLSRRHAARKLWQHLNGQADAWVSGRADAPPELLESEELAWLVRATLIELPDRYRSLLTSRYLDGASSGQIARDTQSSPEAVRAMLARARKAFRKAFTRMVGPERDRSWSVSDEQSTR